MPRLIKLFCRTVIHDYRAPILIDAVKGAGSIASFLADNTIAESTREREVAPLQSIRDAFPRMTIVREGSYSTDIDSVRIDRIGCDP